MLDESAHLPIWVRRRDGSQVPFDADQICQSLYAAAESLGTRDAFLIRELTDAVVHFLGRETWQIIPTTQQIAAEVAKIVREIGHPQLARCYAEMQEAGAAEAGVTQISIPITGGQGAFLEAASESYALDAVFSRDVGAAVRAGLLSIATPPSPALTTLVVDAPRFAELPWWIALEDWRAAGGKRWIVDSPEWLCTHHMHPAMTPHLCERLLSLPIVGQREVELHLNVAEPPAWSAAQVASPLFASTEDDTSQQERSNFLDGLLERWKALQSPKLPAIAWHISERTFRDEIERRQLHSLLRPALQGKPIRFLFDRPRTPIALSEGMDRRSPGVLLEVGLELMAFAQRADIALDASTMLQKAPSLARIAVSALGQQRRYLREAPDDSPLKQRFLIDRAAGAVVPLGLDETVRAVTGESLMNSPLSLDFALKLLQTLRDALHQAGRAIHLDFRLECPPSMLSSSLPPEKQLEIAGRLHQRTGAGTATLILPDEAEADVDGVLSLLHHAWRSTGVVRLQLQRASSILEQGELKI